MANTPGWKHSQVWHGMRQEPETHEIKQTTDGSSSLPERSLSARNPVFKNNRVSSVPGHIARQNSALGNSCLG